ncbi:MAG: hypothetical protein P8K27_07875 [Gammaproteobacteria bacterium]|nr:hypothetical protein [Gammaproteobacteria bacterium]
MLEQRAQYLAGLADPVTQLQRLAGLSEGSLNQFVDTVANNIANQEDDGHEPNQLDAMLSARDQ